MLDLNTRRVILHLHRLGHAIRAIARAVGHSRKAVREVLRTGAEEVPRLERAESGIEHLDCIRELFDSCEGNRQRVWEELGSKGVELSYSTLTGLMRRHGIGVQEKQRVGSYDFVPGQEMQHDTSPHQVVIGGRKGLEQCAALVLCFSHRSFAQLYPRWDRFHCKIFLTDALRYFRGAAHHCMVDNLSVVIARGTGPNAVPAPEMAAFADRFGFRFVAHRVGDVNRSAQVERLFSAKFPVMHRCPGDDHRVSQ
jgi:transposase